MRSVVHGVTTARQVVALTSGVMTTDVIEQALSREGLLRAKGWVQTDTGPVLVQVVGRRVETTPDEPPDPAFLGRVVLIERAG